MEAVIAVFGAFHCSAQDSLHWGATKVIHDRISWDVAQAGCVSVFPTQKRHDMNLLVKRFLVLALPFMILSSSSQAGYGICVENNSGIELESFSIANSDHQFVFGDVSEGAKTGLGNADLQFGPHSPQLLNVEFTPKNGSETIKSQVEIPVLGEGESIKLSINSYLDLINHRDQ